MLASVNEERGEQAGKEPNHPNKLDKLVKCPADKYQYLEDARDKEEKSHHNSRPKSHFLGGSILSSQNIYRKSLNVVSRILS